MNETTVVNIRKCNNYDIYIGRRKDTQFHFGNPFSNKDGVGTVRVATHDECVDAHMLWLTGVKYNNIEQERRQWILENLHTLRGKVLGCYCKPKRCHGDNYIELLEREDCPDVDKMVASTNE